MLLLHLLHIFGNQTYDVHTDAGVANARDVYGITVGKTGGAALGYSGITAEIDTTKDILLGKANATDNADKFKAVTPQYTTVAGFTNLSIYIPTCKRCF